MICHLPLLKLCAKFTMEEPLLIGFSRRVSKMHSFPLIQCHGPCHQMKLTGVECTSGHAVERPRVCGPRARHVHNFLTHIPWKPLENATWVLTRGITRG